MMGALLCALSNFLYIGERLAMWIAVMFVLTCLVVTLIVMLGLGVGLGYNYCFVDFKTKHKYVPGYYEYDLYKGKRFKNRNYRKMADGRLSEIDEAAIETETNQTKIIDEVVKSKVLEKNVSALYTPEENVIETVEVIDTSNSGSDTITEMDEVPSKTVLKIDGLDLMTLLAKLKAENRNYTVQILTT